MFGTGMAKPAAELNHSSSGMKFSICMKALSNLTEMDIFCRFRPIVYIHFNKVQYNRHSENCKHFHSLRFDYNLSHLQKKGLIRINEPCTMAIKGFMLWNFKAMLLCPMVWYLQGVPKKTPNYWNNVLLEFECISTLLNPQVHKILT